MEQKKYLNKFIKIYPILKGFTDDLLFFIAIDTLFFTIAKGLSAQQIVLLTTISSIFSLLCRMTLIKTIERIGNTKSVRIGMGLLLLSSIIITFGTSYLWIIIGKVIYEISWVFKDMEHVMLKNNLTVLGKANDYAKISNQGMSIYAFLTLIVALSSGFLFNITPYLPMHLCIIICTIAFIMYFNMKDVSNNNIIITEKKENGKVKFSKIIWVLLISYAMFYGAIVAGQQNGKLLIQYELADIYDTAKVSIHLGIIVTISRLSRLLGCIIFGKVYYRIKDKSLLILTIMLFASFVFIAMGYFIEFTLLRFILMSIGFCIILTVRDPFKLYTQDTILKLAKPEEKQEAISYVQFARKLGGTICSLLVSAILLKWQLIYVIIMIGILAIIEVFIAMRLYSMLNIKENNKNIDKMDYLEEGETENEAIFN